MFKIAKYGITSRCVLIASHERAPLTK